MEGLMKEVPEAVKASQVGDLDKLMVLLDRGADINTLDGDKRTPLHWAAANGHMQIVQHCLECKGVNIASQDDGGWTPLMSAVSSGRTGVVQMLLSKKADANLTNLNGAIALHYHKGQVAILSMVLQSTNDVNVVDKYGITALHKAVSGTHPPNSGYDECAELLLKAGANQIADKQGNTPLHYAVMDGNDDIAESLALRHGALTDAVNEDGKTPLEMAGGELRELLSGR
jgi:ankyrin repeat protein